VQLLAVAATAAVGVCACYCTRGNSGAGASTGSSGSTTAHRKRNAPSSVGRRHSNAPATGPQVRSFGSAVPADAACDTKNVAPRPALHQTDSPVVIAAAVIAQEGIKLRSNAGRFSPVVSAPAGSKLPGYDRKPPAGGRRQAAPLVVGASVSVIETGADRGGAPWLRVETAEGVVGWLAQSSVGVQPKPEQCIQ
jgi:hypothetical protein